MGIAEPVGKDLIQLAYTTQYPGFEGIHNIMSAEWGTNKLKKVFFFKFKKKILCSGNLIFMYLFWLFFSLFEQEITQNGVQQWLTSSEEFKFLLSLILPESTQKNFGVEIL